MKGVEFPISDIVVKLFGLSAASDLKSRCFGRLPKRGYANSIVDLFPGGAMRFLSLIDGLDLQFPQIVVTQNGSSSEIKRTKEQKTVTSIKIHCGHR